MNLRNLRLPLIGVVFLLLFYPILPSLFKTYFEDSNNSHGLLVPIITCWLIRNIYQSKKDFLQKSEYSQNLNLLFITVICLLILLYFSSFVIGISFFSRISFVSLLIVSTCFLLGPTNTSYFLFPLIFLVFMIPIPTSIYSIVALPLQLFTTKVSVFLLHFTPLDVSAEGNIIRVGKETLEVAEACSGLRSLISFVMISSLFAYLSKVRFLMKLVIFILAIPIAVLGNLIRVVLTTFIADIYGTEIAAGFIHDLSGYLMFIFGFFIFITLTKWFEKCCPN